MASISGTYRETHIVNIAAMETLVNAHLASENARMIVLGGAATLITGSINVNVLCDNGAGATLIHKTTQSINCPTVADTVTLVAALVVFLNAVETESAYTNVQEVSVTLSASMSN